VSGEHFAAIPLRALSDRRLSRGDFRMLGALAYFDRLGRNHAGCFAGRDKIAEVSGIRAKDQARHTAHLEEFGYLEIKRSATDRRKRIYSLIYEASATGDAEEKVRKDADKTAEKVRKDADKICPETAAKSLAARPDLERGAAGRDGVKHQIKYPAKQAAARVENSAQASPVMAAERSETTDARQGGGAAPGRPDQGEMCLLSDVNLRTRNHPKRRKLASERLGAAILVRPELYDRLDAKRWPRWFEAYERAVDAEAERPGAGIPYLAGALKRHSKRERAA